MTVSRQSIFQNSTLAQFFGGGVKTHSSVIPLEAMQHPTCNRMVSSTKQWRINKKNWKLSTSLKWTLSGAISCLVTDKKKFLLLQRHHCCFQWPDSMSQWQKTKQKQELFLERQTEVSSMFQSLSSKAWKHGARQSMCEGQHEWFLRCQKWQINFNNACAAQSATVKWLCHFKPN